MPSSGLKKMKDNTKEPKLELLAPAGDMEKLKTAVRFGADAVYFGGELFSLRAGAGNLSIKEIEEGMDWLHSNDAKGYMTINIYAHNGDISPLTDYIKQIAHIPVDAYLVSDPGIMQLIKQYIPGAEIHMSTQANTTNYLSAGFWESNGVKRIVTAREMSLEEIKIMRGELSKDTEIEAFVHGAMCISYSGRCLLSNFMAGRDANHGACTHPCRWKYALVEEQRPGEYYPVEEDERGSYIMNSRDLCMIDKIPDLAEAGVYSFKIEGRMKSMYYVATVVSAYRAEMDSYIKDPVNYKIDPASFDELCKASHREFTHGFYFNKPSDKDQNYLTSDYTRDYSFVGLVTNKEDSDGLTTVEQRNKFSLGDTVEIFGPRTKYYEETIKEMYDDEGNAIDSAPHPQQILKIRFENKPEEGFIIRKKKELKLSEKSRS